MGHIETRKGSLNTGWRTLHLVVSVDGQFAAVELTELEIADAEVAPDLLNACGTNIGRITAGGGYDRKNMYRTVSKLGAKVMILPSTDAIMSD